MYTRKNKSRKQRGAGIFDFFTSSKTNNTSNTNALQAKRNYNLAHSKSRVANVLRTPGTVSYTNKERIEKEYQEAINELKKMENPKESISALEQLKTSIEKSLQSQTSRETGAVVLTIPVGLAQLAIKTLRICLAVLVFLVAAIPSVTTVSSLAVNLAAGIAPNAGFQTTANVYSKARRFTGANKKE